MTDDEIAAEYWCHDNLHTPKQIVLADDVRLFPSADPEGNGSGAFVGLDKDGLMGATYTGGRELADAEFEQMGWLKTHHGAPPVLQFEDRNGTKYAVFPACDPEHNGPGAVFGRDGDEAFRFQTHSIPESDNAPVQG
ncbi:hypothetical protein C451_00745 [Halococcus thailandensis JCM 13552]|uniref:Uncharacterized protein n=2 Tax=Halococcus thailandensis TaxID=335952 RepID=M0NJ68_9EURY|nr:hypothetical protein C451_00745 [Halococcus thailandensis JCM 13552]